MLQVVADADHAQLAKFRERAHQMEDGPPFGRMIEVKAVVHSDVEEIVRVEAPVGLILPEQDPGK